MQVLHNKVILVISPQQWGTMFLSKHHYALALAQEGNEVYFLNPPSERITNGTVEICRDDAQDGLFFINHSLWFPYNLKFHWSYMFHLLMGFHVKNILRKIGEKIDIIWSFDLGNLYPFNIFPATAFKVFHPVDEPISTAAIRSAKGCEIIFSVTEEILNKYQLPVPKYFINHGIAPYFFNIPPTIGKQKKIRVGLAGNLLRNDIDRPVLLQVIHENPGIDFEFWGSYQNRDSNIGGNDDSETISFINDLVNCKNVKLTGPVASTFLPGLFNTADIFLICYDVQRDQSKGTNYHKVMEYLSTGKVIVSNNISTYNTSPDLVTMVKERNSNASLPGLFKQVVNDLAFYNSEEKMHCRRAFALAHTYQEQLRKIDAKLYSHFIKERAVAKPVPAES